MLVGLIDPSHNTRRKLEEGQLPPWHSLDEIEARFLDAGPKWSNWTHEMAAAVLGEHQERGKGLSVTALVASCPRGLVLERMEDWVGDLDAMYAAIRGTMVHRTLEGYARQESIAEARFWTTVDGIEISGSPDLLTIDTIYDYKVTETPPSFGYPYRGHTKQLMYGAFIIRHAERWESETPFPFDPVENHPKNAVIVYLGPKGPKQILVQRKEEFITPTGAVKEGKRPYVWDDNRVLAGNGKKPTAEDYDPGLRRRLHQLAEAFDIYPDFNPEWLEDWGGEADWACPGYPRCKLPNCLAKRRPSMYVWESPS